MKHDNGKTSSELHKLLHPKPKCRKSSHRGVTPSEPNLKGSNSQFHHLDFVIGTWIHDPEFDKIIEEQRQIDPEMWK